MSEKVKIILSVVLGIVSALAIFSLIVVIGCSVNGLTFGNQVCEWFGSCAASVNAISSNASSISSLPIAI